MRAIFLILIAGCSDTVGTDAATDAIPTDPITDDGTTDDPTDGAVVDSDDTGTGGGGDNEPPVADAGADQTATVPQEVELDGSASFDPDNDALNYEWIMLEKPSGSSAFLINENRATPSFYADRAGLYVVELTVDDGFLSDTDDVEVMVDAPNEGPVANAGPDQSVDVGDRVALNGSSSYDPDGDSLTFAWTILSTPAGSTASLDNPSSTLPQFTADRAGAYVVELRVSDGTDTSDPDQVRVIAQEASSDGDCLSCAAAQQQINQQWSAGNAASALGLLLLPFGLLLAGRKRS